MRSFESMRTRAAVHFILQALVLCAVAVCYVKLYYPFRSADGSILERLQANLTWALLFLGTSAVWFVNYFAVHIKYSRIKRIYGTYFGGIVGRLLLLAEFVGYALAIAFLLMK